MPRLRSALSLCVAAMVVTQIASSSVAASPPPEHPGAQSKPRQDPYYKTTGDARLDALHYGLDLHWAPKSSTLTGSAAIRFRAMRDSDTFVLQLGSTLDVSAATLDGDAITTTHNGRRLVLHTPELAASSRHTVVIDYAGTPRPAHAPTDRSDIPSVGWTTEPDGTVWTMQEPYGAFTWYPSDDQPSDKAYYDATIDVPAKWTGVFNGELTDKSTENGRTVTTWHLASPASTYLVTIAIGDYREIKDTGPHGLPITYWVRPRDAGLVDKLKETPRMIGWIERLLGPYPFDRLGVVLVPSDSAMETQTMVTMGARTMHAPWGRSDLAHEFMHQWYGDTVTPRTWPDVWMNESFAMYVQARWQARFENMPFKERIANWLTYDQYYRDQAGPPGRWKKNSFGDGNVYYCGAVMLANLADKVGHKRFDALLAKWPQTRRFGNADRFDFIDWFNARTGGHYRHYILTWLNSPTTPEH